MKTVLSILASVLFCFPLVITAQEGSKPVDKAKLEAFNWHVLEVDGHNFEQIVGACEEAKAIFEKPVMIIAHTIPGKGVDFMEFDPKWHGLPPNAGEAVEALRELRTLKGKLEEE